MANELSPLRLAESSMFLSTVWPLLFYSMVLNLVTAAMLSASCHFALHILSQAFLMGLEALVDFCLPIPTSWSYFPEPWLSRFQVAGLKSDFCLLGSGVPPCSAKSPACCAGEIFPSQGARLILKFTFCISLPWEISLFFPFSFDWRQLSHTYCSV